MPPVVKIAKCQLRRVIQARSLLYCARRSVVVLRKEWKVVWEEAKAGKLHLMVAWFCVVYSLSQNFCVFLLKASSSSILGKHSVRCFIGVDSRLKRFPFFVSELCGVRHIH